MSLHPVMAIYRGLDARRERPAVFDGDRVVSHGALVERVEAAAAELVRRGLAGARIGLCAANSAGHVAAYLAILRAGCVWVPLNPRNGPRLNAELQARAGLALTLVDAASRDALPAGSNELSLDALMSAPPLAGALPPPPDDPDAVFAIKFTGGSTGAPKGVVQTLRSAAAAMASLEGFYGFGPDDVNLAVAPLTHGASHYVLPVLAAGGAHVVLAQPDRALILDELRRRVSVAFMPPTLIHLLLAEGAFAPADFPRLRHITYSAAPMAPAAIKQAIGRFGPVLSTLYGQTEAPMAITAASPADLADPALRASVGRPFPDTPVAVLTADGDVVARNAEGEVLVGGDLAHTRYLDDPEQTAASRHLGWLRTGDVGRIDASGALFLLGRARELIITGGYNVYPAEVERALAAHPAVREVCAFGVPDPLWGERLEAAVSLSAEIAEDALKAFVREAIGPVRTPKTIHRVPALPRNPVGKVVRSDVRDLLHKEQTSHPEERTSHDRRSG